MCDKYIVICLTHAISTSENMLAASPGVPQAVAEDEGHQAVVVHRVAPLVPRLEYASNTRLRINGVNTNGAAAKVMIFERLVKKVRPGTSVGEIKVG